MAELKCPHCGQAFTVDDTELDSIIKQIRDREFEKDVNTRVTEACAHLEDKHEAEVAKLEDKHEAEVAHLEDKHEAELAKLEAKISQAEDKQKIAVMEAVNKATEEKHILENDLHNQKEKYELQLQEKDKLIELYRDMKTKMSTKMVGESLEQHCEIEFNKLRATAFARAEFGKDNDARSGSKGDYIYREFDENGVEIISIMFEMKNEMETTATKHKNEDFFKELDKDRKEKNCDYAVLVSLLEADNDLYNAGIVDVSYCYDKMYVVRPQCFIPIITILRDASLRALEYKQELAFVKNQNIDITNFEESLMEFKDNFGKNYRIAHDHFDKAIDEIDKTITHLQKVKSELLGSDRQLGIATGKVEEVTIKKLTKDNPTMQAKFAALKEE